jgi:hypothetical protein
MNNGPNFTNRSERSEAWKMLNRVDFNELAMAELNTLATMINQAKKRRGKETVNTIDIGDTVSWMSGRTRGRYANIKFTGKVIKINRTRVKVASLGNGSGVWNVPGSMLTRVA